jgi:hypothetical protein
VHCIESLCRAHFMHDLIGVGPYFLVYFRRGLRSGLSKDKFNFYFAVPANALLLMPSVK